MKFLPWREDRLDRWNLIHLLGSTLIAILAAMYLWTAKGDLWKCILLAAICGVFWEVVFDGILGISVKLFDRRGFSWKDILSNFSGDLIAWLWLVLPYNYKWVQGRLLGVVVVLFIGWAIYHKEERGFNWERKEF